MPSRLNCSLFLGTGGGPLLLEARGSSAISFLLALIERSLALVNTDKIDLTMCVYSTIVTIPVVVISWLRNTKLTWSKEMFCRGS